MSRRTYITIITLVFLSAVVVSAQEKPRNAGKKFEKAFTENFDKQSSKYFDENHGRGNVEEDFRYYPGIPSLTENGTDVMMFRIDPEDPAGAGRGPEIATRKMTHFGTYRARLRVPDVKKVQPNIGSVVGYFTYRMDSVFGLSEIDFEWLLADPRIIFIGTWTGGRGGLQRVGRTIDLSKGEIYYTIYRSARDGNINHDITGIGNQPETVPAIEGYDASKRFYEYGFDWYPDRLTWWIINPDTNEKIVLWDYQGSTPDFTGIPVSPTTYMLNFWHTNNWPVDTNPDSIEKPAYPYELEVDWMSYEPFVEESKIWIKENNWKF